MQLYMQNAQYKHGKEKYKNKPKHITHNKYNEVRTIMY